MEPEKIPAIEDLIAAMERAVELGNLPRSFELARIILQRLSIKEEANQNFERRVQELLLTAQTLAAEASKTEWSEVDTDVSDFDVEKSSAENSTGKVYPVWFGTNREPGIDPGTFSNRRSNTTSLGRVLVNIPKTHRFGELGNGLLKRLLRWDLRRDRLRIQEVAPRDTSEFYKEIGDFLSEFKKGGDSPQALVFLHGFNVSFEGAAIRAAQIGFDLKVPGATAFFSWPSRGTVSAYLADEATIEASERAITDFLVDFTGRCGAEKVHIIAHSMGNRGFLRALQRMAANATTRGNIKFGQIFLAAPDVDRDLFVDLSDLYRECSDRTTLYSSNRDLPVHLSAKLHDSPRAGYHAPYTVVPGIDTVSVPNFDIDALGHTYFAQAEALLHDIYDLIRHGEEPSKRQRLNPLHSEGSDLWEIQR